MHDRGVRRHGREAGTEGPVRRAQPWPKRFAARALCPRASASLPPLGPVNQTLLPCLLPPDCTILNVVLCADRVLHWAGTAAGSRKMRAVLTVQHVTSIFFSVPFRPPLPPRFPPPPVPLPPSSPLPLSRPVMQDARPLPAAMARSFHRNTARTWEVPPRPAHRLRHPCWPAACHGRVPNLAAVAEQICF